MQHKKRGRPRLREDAEQAAQAFGEDTAPQLGPERSSRPIAQPRHRRNESYRSLQSLTSEESPSWPSTTPSSTTHAIMQSPKDYQPVLVPATQRPYHEVPTALLDLDFVVVRANAPFEQIISAGQPLRGRSLIEAARSVAGHSLQNIRNSLRGEREAREPAYMPPILQTGQDPYPSIDASIDDYTQGFSDTMHTWTQTQLGSSAQTFPARLRLGKAGVYFVAVTLPSFQPLEVVSVPRPAAAYSGPLILGPPLPGREAGPISHSQSAPPRTYISTTHSAAAPIPPPPPQPHSRSYPPMRPPAPSQPYTAHPLQSFPPPARPPPPTIPAPPSLHSNTAPYIPRGDVSSLTAPTGPTRMQLPPLVISGPSSVSARSRANTLDSIIMSSQVSSEDDSGETAAGGNAQRASSPKKRRRVGIEDVLQGARGS